MCAFARSKDRYRLTLADFERLLPEIETSGVKYIRFTGGETLLHKEIEALIACCAAAQLQSSLITNGFLLEKKVKGLVGAGLNHLILSLDGAVPNTHDQIRQTKGLFEKALAGLRLALSLGLTVRVNTVVGPDNYKEMPELYRMLCALGVHQWELSSLKLATPLVYEDPAHVIEIGTSIYQERNKHALKILGPAWYGETDAERERYFKQGITPRPTQSRCHVVEDVMFLDGLNDKLYCCSCLSHQKLPEDLIARAHDEAGSWQLQSTAILKQRAYYAERGPTSCRTCSTTAAGYSRDVERGSANGAWSY